MLSWWSVFKDEVKNKLTDDLKSQTESQSSFNLMLASQSEWFSVTK